MNLKVKSNGINFNVPTIENLPTERLEEDLVCVVTDENRGGVFVYREANALVNNGGTIFNGWTRQYDGAVNVKWFGAKGDWDGLTGTDDTIAIQNALDLCINSELFIPVGVYKTTATLTVNENTSIIGEYGCGKFRGYTEASLVSKAVIRYTGLTGKALVSNLNNSYGQTIKNICIAVSDTHNDIVFDIIGKDFASSGIEAPVVVESVAITRIANLNGAYRNTNLTGMRLNCIGTSSTQGKIIGFSTFRDITITNIFRGMSCDVSDNPGTGSEMSFINSNLFENISFIGTMKALKINTGTVGGNSIDKNTFFNIFVQPSHNYTLVAGHAFEKTGTLFRNNGFIGIYVWDSSESYRAEPGFFNAQLFSDYYHTKFPDKISIGYNSDYNYHSQNYCLFDVGKHLKVKSAQTDGGFSGLTRGVYEDTDKSTTDLYYATKLNMLNGFKFNVASSLYEVDSAVTTNLRAEITKDRFITYGSSIANAPMFMTTDNGANGHAYFGHSNNGNYILGVAATSRISIGLNGSSVYGAYPDRFQAESDNLKALGISYARWSVVYAGTGTINTSDAREKTFSDIPEVEMQVAKELKSLVRRFKFNDAIEAKGIDNARIHYGTSAQEVIEVFKKYGLDAMQYAMVCYDEWDEEQEIVDEDGNVTQAYRPAGSRYGIRYEELIMFILGAM